MRRGVIAITKCDLADDEQLELVDLEVAELVADVLSCQCAANQGVNAHTDRALPSFARR